MEISNKVRKLIYSMFDTMVEGVDKYKTKSSTWLIFTDEKKWVLEFTKEKILWFNYGTFQSELVLLGMDCVDSKDVIKEWFESRFLGIEVEDTIQNGVKHTWITWFSFVFRVEDTIQNGVKHTHPILIESFYTVEDTIQNGVKHTTPDASTIVYAVEDTVQNGVKQTELSKRDFFPKDIIQNGVKS